MGDWVCSTCGEVFYGMSYPKLGYCPLCRDKDSLEELDEE